MGREEKIAVASPLDISEQEIRERCAGLLSAAIDEAARLSHNTSGQSICITR